ncbi:hypothetical protein OAN00_07315 [Pseudomonadales bacterium]|nr:hypothetical protein [Pseudomonadales bacterium]
MDWEEESPETEEDGIRAEALRRLKVRQQLQGQRDRIRASSQPQKNTQSQPGSPSQDNRNTTK